MIDPSLLELLACPRCASRPPLELQNDMLVCTECGCGYRIVDGIPHLLAEEAISPDQLQEHLIERNET